MRDACAYRNANLKLFPDALALTAAARQVQVSMFHRPRSVQRFEQGVAHLAAALTEATVG